MSGLAIPAMSGLATTGLALFNASAPAGNIADTALNIAGPPTKSQTKKPLRKADIAGLIFGLVGFITGLRDLGNIGYGLFSEEKDLGTPPKSSVVNFWIANNGPHPTDPKQPLMRNAGGDVPDIRLFGDGGNFIGATYKNGRCEDGSIHCEHLVHTDQYASYVLLSGNKDPICIAFMSVQIPQVDRKFGFAPGNWAPACSKISGKETPWYYANMDLPLKSAEQEPSKCLWIGRGEDNHHQPHVSGMQLRMKEFRANEAPIRPMEYYCSGFPVLDFRFEKYPNKIKKWAVDPLFVGKERPTGPYLDPSYATEAEDTEEIEIEPITTEPLQPEIVMGTFGDAAVKERNRHGFARLARRWIGSPELAEQMAMDPSVIKSHWPEHRASELCNRNAGALGHSFVSYAEKKFCYMPTKTLYEFCDNITEGACWSEDENKVIIKRSDTGMVTISAADIPDLRHADSALSVVWGEE